MRDKEISYSELKEAYVTIINLLIDSSGEEKINLKSRIQEDLGMYGDDNYDMLIKLQEKYKINFSSFDYKKHFNDEAEVSFSPKAFIDIIFWPITLLLLLISYLIKHINLKISERFKKIAYKPYKIFKYRKTEDLTVGDIATSYIEKKFTLKKDIRYLKKKK